jgi:predicted phosphohydrolase
LEFYNDTNPPLRSFISNPEDADYLCLCGDIGDPWTPNYKSFLEECVSSYNIVFLIAGNHEMYGHTIDEVNAMIQEVCASINNNNVSAKATCNTIVYMSNSSFTIPHTNITIVGSTLWSEIAEYERFDVANQVSDFKHIKNWSVDTCNYENFKAIKYIKRQVQDARANKTQIIVVTHHPPSWSCGNPRHRGSSISCAFKNRLDDFIRSNNDVILAWFYGHDHYSMDFLINTTRIFSNQFGYIEDSRITDIPTPVIKFD